MCVNLIKNNVLTMKNSLHYHLIMDCLFTSLKRKKKHCIIKNKKIKKYGFSCFPNTQLQDKTSAHNLSNYPTKDICFFFIMTKGKKDMNKRNMFEISTAKSDDNLYVWITDKDWFMKSYPKKSFMFLYFTSKKDYKLLDRIPSTYSVPIDTKLTCQIGIRPR